MGGRVRPPDRQHRGRRPPVRRREREPRSSRTSGRWRTPPTRPASSSPSRSTATSWPRATSRIPLLEKIGRDSVRVNYDTANVEFYSGDKAVDDLPKITPYLAHVHLKDTTGGKGNWNFAGCGDGDRRLRPRARDPARRRVRRPALGRDRVRGRAVAAARRRQRRDAPLVRAPELARALVGGTDAASIFMPEMTNLQVREYLEAAAGRVIVPVGSTEDHGDHGPLWTDVYIPLEVAQACGRRSWRRSSGHRSRSASHTTTAVRTASSTCGMDTFSRPRARRLPFADGCRLHADRPAQRALLQLARARVRGRAVPRRPARGRARVPVPVLGRDGAGGGGAVPLRHAPASTRTSARPRSCSRSTTSCATWSESATSHRRCPSYAPTRSRCSTRCSSPRPDRSGRCSRTVAACGGDRASRRPRRARSSSRWATRAVVNLVRDMDDVHDQLEPRYLRTRRPRGASR